MEIPLSLLKIFMLIFLQTSPMFMSDNWESAEITSEIGLDIKITVDVAYKDEKQIYRLSGWLGVVENGVFQEYGGPIEILAYNFDGNLYLNEVLDKSGEQSISLVPLPPEGKMLGNEENPDEKRLYLFDSEVEYVPLEQVINEGEPEYTDVYSKDGNFIKVHVNALVSGIVSAFEIGDATESQKFDVVYNIRE